MVIISSVEEGSPAGRAGIREGDALAAINGHPVRDVLDYRFFITEKRVTLTLCREGERFEVTLKKREYDDVGLGFETFLMDEKQSCRNKCIFCFIDQNPKGMRETVYFKDDDTRLSFLMGNYVTLTNVGFDELDRIRKMHISPVNVSVHTTDPGLRVKMLGNRFAGDIMEKLKYLADGGISLNCQLVLCRGINDGAALEKTLADLFGLRPAVESVAAVPAGLTAHREGLYPLAPYDRGSAAEVLDLVGRFQDMALERAGTRFVFCSDEFYITAGRPVPDGEFYEGYPQLDNGVGTVALMESEVRDELGEELPPVTVSATVFCGMAAKDYVADWVERIRKKAGGGAKVDVIPVENRFFGSSVTVSGLLTGSDVLAAARGLQLNDRVLLPSKMLRSEGDLFLDGMSRFELGEKLERPLFFTDTAAQLAQALTLGAEETSEGSARNNGKD